MHLSDLTSLTHEAILAVRRSNARGLLYPRPSDPTTRGVFEYLVQAGALEEVAGTAASLPGYVASVKSPSVLPDAAVH